VPPQETTNYVKAQADGSGNYEDWGLQELANKYGFSLLIVSRQSHDGETADLDELIENCPLYLALATHEVRDANQASFDPTTMVTEGSDLAALLRVFGLDPNTQPSFRADTCDVDAGTELYTPSE
jgi:hypothetical protein